MSGGVARGRLAEERKAWRQNHPHGFVAKPEIGPDGSVNLMIWKCIVPGNTGTDWEGGHYPVTLKFDEDYPSRPPKCKFPKGFLHPNVFPTGHVCLSILGDVIKCTRNGKPAIIAKQILVGIHNLLDEPNPASPANDELNELYVEELDEYKRRVRLQAQEYPRII